MPKVAFELRSGFEDFSGGTVALADGEAFDVAEALSKGGGKIVLSPDAGERKDPDAQAKENERARADAQLLTALDGFPALKRAAQKGGE